MKLNGWTTEAIAATLVSYAFVEIAEQEGAPDMWSDQATQHRFVSLMGLGRGAIAMPRAVVASLPVSGDSKAWGHTSASALERVAEILAGTPWEISLDTRQVKRHRKSAAILTW